MIAKELEWLINHFNFLHSNKKFSNKISKFAPNSLI